MPLRASITLGKQIAFVAALALSAALALPALQIGTYVDYYRDVETAATAILSAKQATLAKPINITAKRIYLAPNGQVKTECDYGQCIPGYAILINAQTPPSTWNTTVIRIGQGIALMPYIYGETYRTYILLHAEETCVTRHIQTQLSSAEIRAQLGNRSITRIEVVVIRCVEEKPQ